MNRLHRILILVAAYLLVFFEAWFDGFRDLFGAQIDFLPALMVYTGLSDGLAMVCVTAICSGLWFDSLSANPLGVSVLPLLCIGVAACRGRETLARDERATQFLLGAAASAFQPLAVLFILANIGTPPLIGWKSIWQLIVMAVGGGLAVPAFYALFHRVHHAFDYPEAFPGSFRPDRQIKRGRL